jgi:hypothetical protein
LLSSDIFSPRQGVLPVWFNSTTYGLLGQVGLGAGISFLFAFLFFILFLIFEFSSANEKPPTEVGGRSLKVYP